MPYVTLISYFSPISSGQKPTQEITSTADTNWHSRLPSIFKALIFQHCVDTRSTRNSTTDYFEMFKAQMMVKCRQTDIAHTCDATRCLSVLF